MNNKQNMNCTLKFKDRDFMFFSILTRPYPLPRGIWEPLILRQHDFFVYSFSNGKNSKFGKVCPISSTLGINGLIVRVTMKLGRM